MARQVGVTAGELGFYEWTGRTVERHRGEIRTALGFRECSVGDAEKLTGWLADRVAEAERRPERVREALLARCRSERIEPPAGRRINRIVASALRQAEKTLSLRISGRLPALAVERLKALVVLEADPGEEEEAVGILAKIKSDPGEVSLDSMLTEIDKLLAVRTMGLPPDLFAGVAPKTVAGWRARAAVEAPSHLRAHTVPLRLTLLAALLHAREGEITDALVELSIATVHRINGRAEKKVKEELIREFTRVTGKETILFHMAEASSTTRTSRCETSYSRPCPAGSQHCGTSSPSTGIPGLPTGAPSRQR